jgi:hypothetical protein
VNVSLIRFIFLTIEMVLLLLVLQVEQRITLSDKNEHA